MPRIPMGEAAGLVRNREDAVEMRGAPGMDFGMDVGRALSDLGRGIGETGRRLGDIGLAFGRQMQETEDRLNATKAESIWRAKQSELRVRMADNPGAYGQFGDWAKETDLAYEEEAKPYLEKMSKRSRELFDARMVGIRKEAINDRTRIGIQARNTAAYNLFQEQCKEKAIQGDELGYMQMILEHRGKLISETEYQQKRKDYYRLSQYGEAKRRIESGEWGVWEDLKATDEDGRYIKYQAMDEKSRMALIKYSETEDAKRKAAEYEDLVERLQSGEVITEADIEKEFEYQDGDEARRRKHDKLEIVRKFSAGKAKEQAREAAARKKVVLDAAEYKIMQLQFSPDAQERKKQYAEHRAMIFRTFVNDGPAVKRLLTQLDEVYKAAEKPDFSYKNRRVYTYAMDYVTTQIKPDDLRTYDKTLGITHKSKNKTSEEASYKRLIVLVDQFIRTNPDATNEEAKEFIDKAVHDISVQLTKHLVSAFDVLDARSRTRIERE